jgi:two-component system, NarL family, nitrate/nitrite response regulator NarL
MAIRVAVVDDHPLFRDGVVATVSAAPEFEVIAEGQSGSDAIRIAKHQCPDILLLDVSMPENGIDAAREISATTPSVKIVTLSACEEIDDIARAAGARKSVNKGVTGPELMLILLGVFFET